MSNKALITLAIVAAGMVAWAVAQSRMSAKPAKALAANTYLIQGLEPDNIGSINIKAKGNEVTLVRDGSRFVVAQKSNYPASNSSVNRLINSCLDLQTADLVSKTKANYTDLGVSEADATNVITFYKPDKSVLTSMVIGKNAEQGRGSYVRLASQETTWLSSNMPYFQTAPMDYIEKNLMQVSKADISKMSVTTPAGSYTITNAAGKPIIDGITAPKGKRIKSDSVEQAFDCLSSMYCDDVKKEGDIKLDFKKTLTAELKNSTVYTISLADANGKSYIKCTADFTDKTPVTKSAEKESDEQLKAKEAKLLARDKADSFTKEHSGWVYEIPDYKTKTVAMAISDLIEDEPNAPKAEPNKPAAPKSQAGEPNVMPIPPASPIQTSTKPRPAMDSNKPAEAIKK
jgi:hypothetical protein